MAGTVENILSLLGWKAHGKNGQHFERCMTKLRVVNKQQEKAVVIDLAIPNNSSIRKKEQQKFGKYQELRGEL